MNALAEDQLRTELLNCCGSREWVQRMVQKRPFDSVEELNRIAAEIWWDCDQHDWLEAFRSHPKIGGRKVKARVSGQSRAWSSQEQSSIHTATTATINDLEQLNREYEEKFGFIFIVCATGKSADEMLAMLRSRLGNDNAKELRIAAGEQAKITELRLRKLIA